MLIWIRWIVEPNYVILNSSIKIIKNLAMAVRAAYVLELF